MNVIEMVLSYTEQHESTLTFLGLFFINVATKILKAWQEYRHTEDRHRQEMRQDDEHHKKSLNQ